MTAMNLEVYQRFATASRISVLSKMKHLYLVILAGGEGTRLFPYSNPERPKQLCPISGEDWRTNTFLKRTIANYVECGFDTTRIIVVTSSDRQEQMTRGQIAVPGGIILDNVWNMPSTYGYAGTMVEVTKRIAQFDPKAIVFNTPADHYLTTGHTFYEAVFTAVNNAKEGRISAIGVKTDDIDTVMTCGNIIYDHEKVKKGITLSQDFVEKPDRKQAEKLIKDGESVCNTGICVWRAEELIKYAPKDTEALSTERLMRAFNGHLRIVVDEFNWQDCGTLRGLYTALDKTARNNNVTLGEGVFMLDSSCKNSLFYADKNMILNVSDARDCAVIFTMIKERPVLVISNLDESQKIQRLAEDYSKHEEFLIDDFSLGARNNRILYSNMYNSFSVGFVNVENVVVRISRHSEDGKIEAEIFERVGTPLD